MGLGRHDRNLYIRWHFWQAPQPGNQHHTQHTPWLSLELLLQIHLDTVPRNDYCCCDRLRSPRDDILHLQGDPVRDSTGIASYTQPQKWASNTSTFFTEFIATAALSCVIPTRGDASNAPPGAGVYGFRYGSPSFRPLYGIRRQH